MRFKVPGGRFLDVVDGMRTSYIASKMAPENGGPLEQELPVRKPSFLGVMLVLGGVASKMEWLVA